MGKAAADEAGGVAYVAAHASGSRGCESGRVADSVWDKCGLLWGGSGGSTLMIALRPAQCLGTLPISGCGGFAGTWWGGFSRSPIEVHAFLPPRVRPSFVRGRGTEWMSFT